MARKGMTQVEGTKLVKIAQHLGLEIEVNKVMTKCYRPGSRRVGLGISNSKHCTLVELTGFSHPLAVPHPKPPAKTCVEMMDFTKTEAQILQDFYQIAAEGLLGAKLAPSSNASPAPARKSKEELIAEFMNAYEPPLSNKERAILEFEQAFSQAA